MNNIELENRYKVIKIKNEGEFKTVDLWCEENDPTYHVRLLFAFNKLFVTGDCGSFIFGKDICHIYEFFKGEETNLGYWSGKCEASPRPILSEEVDINKVDELIRDYFKENVEMDDDEKLEFEEDLDNLTKGPFCALDPNMYRAYDSVLDFFKEHDGNTEEVSSIIDSSRDFDGQYVYICNLIQWVSNNLQEWEKKYAM